MRYLMNTHDLVDFRRGKGPRAQEGKDWKKMMEDEMMFSSAQLHYKKHDIL